MKTKKLSIAVAVIAALVLNSACHHAPGLYKVDRGCVKDEFKIKFVDQPEIELTPDKFFSIDNLKLKTNRYSGSDVGVNGYKRKGLINYKITIERLDNHKQFYGRMAFYDVVNIPQCTNSAVASFYKITIPESYFGEAKDGITVSRYEWYNYNSAKYSTWIIWFSDIPI